MNGLRKKFKTNFSSLIGAKIKKILFHFWGWDFFCTKFLLFGKTDRFDNQNVKQLIENLKIRQQTNTFKLDSVIDNDPYYKEVLFDVRNVNSRLKATISDYFVKKVIQLVALYARDVQIFYAHQSATMVCEEQYYKQTWIKYKLLTIKSLFFLNDLAEEEFAEFFENYSLR